MDNEIISLESKHQKIKENLGEQVTIFTDDIQNIFPEMKKSSLYGMLSKLVNEGYLNRIRNGVYSFNENKGKTAVFLSETARKVEEILDEEGFEYYFSGIDILFKFMQHIPEIYPVILFVKKNAETEIMQILTKNDVSVIKANAAKDLDNDYVYSIMKPQVVVYPTDSFVYIKENVATTEKAFIDLFYAITRNYYPLALEELARIYSNMLRLGALDQKAMVKMSYRRNLQHDIRYIVESKYISDGAKDFVSKL